MPDESAGTMHIDILPHEPSDEYCCLGHSDGHGSCPRCKHCRQWVRPQDMGNPCTVRTLAGIDAQKGCRP
jgi:hypothetical protein